MASLLANFDVVTDCSRSCTSSAETELSCGNAGVYLEKSIVRAAFEYSLRENVSLSGFLGDECVTMRHTPEIQVECQCEAHLRAVIHPFIHPYIHSSIRSLLPSLPPCTHSLTHSLTHPPTHPPTHPLTHSLTHSFNCSFIHSFILSLTHSFNFSFVHLFIHSFIHFLHFIWRTYNCFTCLSRTAQILCEHNRTDECVMHCSAC